MSNRKRLMGLRAPVSVPSPTGRPSAVKPAVQAFDAGKPTAGARPPVKPKKKVFKPGVSITAGIKAIQLRKRKIRQAAQ